MNRLRINLLVTVFAILTTAAVVFAQDEGLSCKVDRDWGYGGFNGDIQGTFTIKCTGPETLDRVDFYIDDKKIGEVGSAPFSFQFVTDNYPVGLHILSAVGTTSEGRQLHSQDLKANFISAAAGIKSILTIIIPILVLVFGGIIIAAVIPLLTGRKRKYLPAGTPRSYPMGGGICPKCGRPFAYQLFGLKLLVGRYERCPYCGKWSLVRHSSIGDLRAAERAELDAKKPQIPEASEEDILKKELDDSKYQSL
jgi:hypothetical protein